MTKPLQQYDDSPHKTISLSHPDLGDDIPVDATIAPLIEAMWRCGWLTFNSCENNFGYVWIEIDHSSAEEFLTLIAAHADDEVLSHNAAYPNPANPSDLQGSNCDPEEWLISAHPLDLREEVVGDEVVRVGPPDIMVTISIRFPVHRLKDVMAIVLTHLIEGIQSPESGRGPRARDDQRIATT